MARATRLTASQIKKLRKRAEEEAIPRMSNEILRARPYNDEWAKEILGHGRWGVGKVSFQDMYLLYLARKEEPDPPQPPKALETLKRSDRETERRHRAALREWEKLKKQLPVPVEVRFNSKTRNEVKHYTIAGAHIYLLEEVRTSTFYRPAGTVLCDTPSRTKQLVMRQAAEKDRVPNCTQCLKTAKRVIDAYKKKGSP